VQKPGGMTLLINGMFEPYQQDEAIQVVDAEAGPGMTNEVVLRVIMTEAGDMGKESSILLESAGRFPIALLNTSAAVGPRDSSAASSSTRHVLVTKESPFTERTDFPRNNFFAIAKAADASSVVLTRSGEIGGPLLLTVQARPESPGHLTVSDVSGKLIGTLEPHVNAPAGHPQQVLRVEQDIDIALVICAVIATAKLGLR